MTPAVALVALDVDGTLLNPSHQVSPATRAALESARHGGMTAVLASSRGPLGLLPVQQELDLLGCWFVAFQGALVARWQTPGEALEVIADHRIDTETAGTITARAMGAGLSISRFVGLRWFVPALDAAIRQAAQITGEVPTVERGAVRRNPDPPHKLMVIAGQERLVPELDNLLCGVRDRVSAAFSHHNYVEITDASVNKGTGLKVVADTLGIPLGHCAAVGDGHNDIAMLQAVGLPIAMGQAPREVTDAASWTTDTNARDGAAKALLALLHGKDTG